MKEILGTFEEFEQFGRQMSGPCLFRGQSNALHKLLPGIGRPHPQYCPSLKLEKAIFRQFKNRARPYLESPHPASDWDWLVIAQHHGLKTRLLDWTTDWKVALYFAALPHDEMYRVPFSVFALRSPAITPHELLPKNPFSCRRDYYFQPPHLHGRIVAQSSYMSVHRNPQRAVTHQNLLQFSLYPSPENRRKCAQFLASSRATAAEIIPGLDGICRALIDEPRIAAQIELPYPQVKHDGEWRRIPASAVGTRVGATRPRMLRERRLSLMLDYVDVEHLVGIPCYLNGKLYGFLKYGNRAHTRLEILLANGSKTVTMLGTDRRFDELQLLRDHIETLMPSEPICIRRIGE